MATPFETFTGGNVVGGMTQVYTDLLGGWFYTIALMSILIIIYYKSKSIPSVTVIGLLVGHTMAFYNLLPQAAVQGLYVMTVLGFGGLLYATWKSK